MAERPTDPPRVAVVILTMGNRPVELDAAVSSALEQTGVNVEVIVIANGVSKADIDVEGDERVTVVESATNVGIPGGRNLGLGRTTAPIVAFLDDDARFIDVTVLARCATSFDELPMLGAIALHVIDEEGRTARRHVPRIGARHPDRSGAVTAFLGGAVVMRRQGFVEAGGYPEAFVYSMEETDLALRLIDRAWRIAYDGNPAVFHPATVPGRHRDAHLRTMRNRVWLAHRTLPAPLAALYVADWLAISALRSPASARALAGATWRGWCARPGPRAPIRWRTVARLTRLGRPPVM